MPTDSPRFGVTFKISHYTAVYRYLIAHEINAQEWKKKLGLEGVREGGFAFSKLFWLRGVQFSYVIIIFFGGGGVKF